MIILRRRQSTVGSLFGSLAKHRRIVYPLPLATMLTTISTQTFYPEAAKVESVRPCGDNRRLGHVLALAGRYAR